MLLYSIILPLNVLNQGLDKIFIALRTEIVHSFNLVPLASSFAALFVIFKLVKIVSDIEGDNEAGGLGHVKLWDMIRPLVFYMFVLMTPSIVSTIDSLVSNVTTAMYNATPSMSIATNEVNDIIQQIKDAYADFTSNYADLNPLKKIAFFLDSGASAILTFLWRILLAGIVWLIQLVYDLVALIFSGIAQIYLCVVIIGAPFVFAFSILEPWKNNYQKLIANMVYFQMWGIIIRFIGACVGLMRIAALKVIKTDLTAHGLGTLGNLTTEAILTSLITCCFLLVGLFACFQTPAIANAIFNLGSNHDAHDSDSAKKIAQFIPGIGKFV